ncbi:dihydrofolate reductase [Actinoplanes sp. CA-142083]|uniref:dihydrofolate reductase n=1 Tax=Actinoplanes sp. CA-142083 TaxID=3239903 RepID=UPI003D92E5A5
MTVHMIWAEARDRVIGAEGYIPWKVPGEQAMFKELTMGATVVMGRATWDSLPAAVRPLPGRRNVVLTRDPAFEAPGAVVVHALDEVPLSGEIWVMGGAAIYEALLPKAQHIVRTRIDLEVAGDTHAPVLDDSWVVTASSGWQTAPNGLKYVTEDLARA